MASERETDPRVYEVSVALSDQRNTRLLTAEESRVVIDRCESERSEAIKWRLMLGKKGRLLIVDDTLCAQIRAVLRRGEPSEE